MEPPAELGQAGTPPPAVAGASKPRPASGEPITDIPMTERLTRNNLRGVWAAIATPFDEQDRFDEGVFRENMRRLHAAGVDGIYTTDADGEFYAIEFEEYVRIVDVFAEEAIRLGVPTQVGVTWINTRGVTRRLRHAAERGILGAHVGHPFFMPMTADSYRAFWEDISAAVPEWFALIHYNSLKLPNYLRGPDYAALASSTPNLVGSKHVNSDTPEFLELVREAPQLSHFASEHTFSSYMAHGARGIYSWFANFNARWLVEWYQAITVGDWVEANRRQGRMMEFIEASQILRGEGNDHAVLGKAITAASRFLVPANRTRRPYLPVPQPTVDDFRRLTLDQFPDMVWPGS